MPLPQPTAASDSRQDSCYWSRLDTAQACAAFSAPFDPPSSQRQYARQHAIPRSTLGYWIRQPFPDHLDADLVRFFRRPAGLAFLRRLVLALLLVFHQNNACGLRQISLVLQLCQLDSFVGSSYGALYSLDRHLQDDLARFDEEHRPALAATMAFRDIALCVDENFHGPHVCLVGIEPCSNFILVEAYADRRDGVTWAGAIQAGVAGLPVHVVALTSDQASGLIRCAEEELKVVHQPELFHLQRDLARPVLLPLARPIRQAEKEWEKACQQTQRLDQAEEDRPCSVALVAMLEAVRAEMLARENLEQARRPLEQAVEHIRAVSRVYHPCDRQTGQPVDVEQMQQRLNAPVQRLAEVVQEQGLDQRAEQAVSKARQWLVVLSGYLGWFWTMVQRRIEELDLSDEANRQLQGSLLGSYYWEMASVREPDPAERKRLRKLSERLRREAWSEGGALAGLSEAEKEQVRRVARECAGLFSRSSSSVEGRNGRLSLYHHGQTRLSERRLKALTVIHNWVVKREDGTTAAERLFGQKHADAFTWLLHRLPELPRPAAKRRRLAAKMPSFAA